MLWMIVVYLWLIFVILGSKHGSMECFWLCIFPHTIYISNHPLDKEKQLEFIYFEKEVMVISRLGGVFYQKGDLCWSMEIGQHYFSMPFHQDLPNTPGKEINIISEYQVCTPVAFFFNAQHNSCQYLVSFIQLEAHERKLIVF